MRFHKLQSNGNYQLTLSPAECAELLKDLKNVETGEMSNAGAELHDELIENGFEEDEEELDEEEDDNEDDREPHDQGSEEISS